jgi:Zn-dependent protease with chaperone function
MAHYILQVLLFQLLFLLVYDFLLKKETFFSYNRWYLLLTPVIALALPLLKFESLGNMIPQDSLMMLPEVYLRAGSATTEAFSIEPVSASGEGFQINWWMLTYGIGVLLSSLLFVHKYRILKDLFKNKIVTNQEGIKIIEVANSNLACTFFNTIFLGDQLKKEEIEQVLSHEMVHVKQKHSADLLYFELFKILFWFNPLIYIYQSKISTLHEFIADAGVVKTVEKKIYYQQLLNTAFSTENISFINQFFNHSLIKKRIVMLQKSRSKTISKFKYLILVPLMLVMLTYVACSKETFDNSVTEQPVQEANVSYAKAGKDGDVPFSMVEEVPVFPGCEDFTSNEERKTCMSEKIVEFVNTNFDVDAAKAYAQPGINRIYVQFRITKEGSVEEMGVRASAPQLEEEARKVINKFPKMTPGKQGGKEVGVLYTLPIIFQVDEGQKEPTANGSAKENENENPTGDIPFAIVEEVPVFPGCESLASNEARRDCMTEKITAFVNKNFDVSAAKTFARPGANRIYAQLRINKDGVVEEMGIRASSPELEEEARKVINQLPQMTPGKQNGQETGVLYMLPINFNAGE